MARLPVVLIHHDTTTLDFSSHHALQGAGPIGDGDGTGFLQHNSLAFSPDGKRLLGLIFQQVFVRQPAPAGESAAARKSRQDRESLVWRHVAVARGVLSRSIPEFHDEIESNLDPKLTPTEWRRGGQPPRGSRLDRRRRPRRR